ncbi:hypothetical protein ACFLYW_02940 [Thermodesulfobacteriota bacterium]
MKKLISVYIVFLLVLFVCYAGSSYAQESSTELLGKIAGDVLTEKAGFTEQEKEIIRRFYRGPKDSESDWRNPDNNDTSSYHWGSDKYDDNDEASGKEKSKKPKGKKKGGKEMPPGLAKKDELPPGLQKQLEKNGTLPPGLAKRDLPSDLLSQLPFRPDTQERTVIDEDVVLIEKATGKILDILYGGARRN